MSISFSASFFTGSINGSPVSGAISGSFASVNGNVFGQFTGSATEFNGYLSGFTGFINGDVSGSYTLNQSISIITSHQYLKRSLLKFDINHISSSIISSKIIDPKFSLKLKISAANNIPLTYGIYAFPISQSWQMGNGVFAYGGADMGCNWIYKDNTDTTSTWSLPYLNMDPPTGLDYLNSDSGSALNFARGGGTWYYKVPDNFYQPVSVTGSQFFDTLSGSNYIASYFNDIIPGEYLTCKEFYNYKTADIDMDITAIVKAWIANAIPNEGIILLSSEEISGESNGDSYKFFSKETNTIYTPYLDIKWDDSVYNTGSLSPIDQNNGVVVNIKNLKHEYKVNSKPKLSVFTREKYPLLLNFSQIQSQYLVPSYLPKTTYYRIQDNESEEVLIDFDDYSKVSLDPNYGHYFVLDTSGLAQERYYKILIKTIYDDGSTEIFDTLAVFKISR